MDEYIDILTEEGKLSGEVKLKSEAHRLGLWHESVQVWVINSKQQVLLQKRAYSKDSYPGLWDISVAGHLSAGDTVIQAALREIHEEIGLSLVASQLCFFKRIKKNKIPKKGFLDNEFNTLFGVKLEVDILRLTLQKEEVEEVKWLSISNFEEQLKQHSKLFVPHGNEYYQYIINELRSL